MSTAKKILIVDDERDYSGVLKDRLVHEGYEVAISHDGVSGLAALKVFGPDVILLDVMMPGMNGFEFVRQMRGHGMSKLPALVYVTAYGREPSEDERKLMEGALLVRKPFDVKELLKLIGTLVS